jgi:hypothetical protein
MENIITPIKTLHGTNADSLQDDYINALNGIRIAKNRFLRIEFNARDYASFELFREAKSQRIDAYIKLEEVERYLETIVESI